MRRHVHVLAIAGASMLLGTIGCTIKGTSQQITDTTGNTTVSTSGAAWWNEDGQIKPGFKAAAFISLNHANLQQDLAAGRGEYLASISRLLGVPEDRQPAFFSATQAGYTKTTDQDPATLLTFLRDTSIPFLR